MRLFRHSPACEHLFLRDDEDALAEVDPLLRGRRLYLEVAAARGDNTAAIVADNAGAIMPNELDGLRCEKSRPGIERDFGGATGEGDDGNVDIAAHIGERGLDSPVQFVKAAPRSIVVHPVIALSEFSDAGNVRRIATGGVRAEAVQSKRDADPWIGAGAGGPGMRDLLRGRCARRLSVGCRWQQ